MMVVTFYLCIQKDLVGSDGYLIRMEEMFFFFFGGGWMEVSCCFC